MLERSKIRMRPLGWKASSAASRSRTAMLVAVVSIGPLTGCITGNEAAEAQAAPTARERLQRLETDHQLGIISDFEYERIKPRLEAEIRNQ